MRKLGRAMIEAVEAEAVGRVGRVRRW
jgi:hypothetical protein